MTLSPIKHDHADSFIGITLLETNGDYLTYIGTMTQRNSSKQKIFTYLQSNEIKKPELADESSGIIIYQQRMTDVYIYEAIGLLLSIFFFYYLILKSLKKSKFRKFLIATVIGMVILLFHSISGLPKNNFDPLGDIFKPFVLFVCFNFQFYNISSYPIV